MGIMEKKMETPIYLGLRVQVSSGVGVMIWVLC